jgi:hypothetical protein
MTLSVSENVVPNEWMTLNNELERCGWKWSCPDLKYYSEICLGELRKTMKNFSRESGPYKIQVEYSQNAGQKHYH